ncbi:hypothetical protein [Marinobacterium aestuariivivens]|uniref:Uncharacterized protein n=1 Tax=Marinobacterium aestuariivivens TaxID=1698799 RepID=A0ABW1ZZA4_9GAMM
MIDFFALSLQPRNPQIRLGYPAPTSVLPVCAALIRGASVPDNGRLFLRYLLSAQGQQVLLQPELSRYPIDGRILAGVPDHPLSRHQPLITERYDYDAQQSRLRYELVNALFDQLITFRLQELQHFWHRYHETAMRLADDSNPKWQADLARARELATTVPFSAEQLGDERLLGQFARYQPGIPLTSEQQRQQDRWRRESADRLEQALRLLRGIADRRAVQDATEEGAD